MINQKGATVGEVLGDGVVLSFSNDELVGVFEVCLRLSLDPVLDVDIVPDFGYTTSDLVFIYPVGLLFFFFFFFFYFSLSFIQVILVFIFF